MREVRSNVVCDRCGAGLHKKPKPHPMGGNAVTAALAKGWEQRRGILGEVMDFCPACVALDDVGEVGNDGN